MDSKDTAKTVIIGQKNEMKIEWNLISGGGHNRKRGGKMKHYEWL
jgi:hypothetical protein